MPMPVTLVPIDRIAPRCIEALLDRVFGEDRHTRTAYRVRAGILPDPDLSFAAVHEESGALLGSIQCWPVELAGNAQTTAMIMVGPVAIAPDHRNRGVGRALMHRAIARAAEGDIAGGDALMLIGDPEYYGRHFGYSAERTGGWRLSGPVERHRLLALGAGVPAGSGIVRARIVAAPQRRLRSRGGLA
ncbi:GNAT family N-acetyltransferase [Stakelama saccharophila]|uniref:N-acetyltransferase n=1 Tax=Stakelama saccharophila TaxID=3075605 RepID=A0ABZ0B6F1_9SPHN|nr:N-acetyltransferase [Stakelama sp. W311]WNO52964.1 N-acetyltransferase [Stakelama sp. W311]